MLFDSGLTKPAKKDGAPISVYSTVKYTFTIC